MNYLLIFLVTSLLEPIISSGVKNTGRDKTTVLTLGSANLKQSDADSKFSVLNPLSEYDFCSIQELEINKTEFITQELGEVIFIKPQLNEHPFLLIVMANAGSVNGPDRFHSFGVYMNPNSGFQYSNHSVHYINGSSEVKGIILVWGKLGDNDFVFGGVHGDWGAEGYDSKINLDGVTRALREISERKPKYYVIVGDFNIKYSLMAKYVGDEWGNMLPDLTLEDGPRFTCFDGDGFGNPDHVLTNIPYRNLKYLFRGGDHMHLSVDIEVEDFEKRKSDLICLGDNEL